MCGGDRGRREEAEGVWVAALVAKGEAGLRQGLEPGPTPLWTVA